MQRPLQITFRGIDPSDAIKARIEEKVEWLGKFRDDLIGCHVVVDARHHHSQQGNLYRVSLDLSVPGAPPVYVGHEHHDVHAHEDVYVAIRDAFDAARRRLQDGGHRQRGDVKVHEVPNHGRVKTKFVDGEGGFIESVDGNEVYFHANAVIGASLDDLEIGDEVRFVVHEGEGRKGLQASTVHPIGHHHLPNVEFE